MEKITVLIPTYNRSEALAVTLTSLCFQNYKAFDIVISDQSEEPAERQPVIAAVTRVLQHHGNRVTFIRNLPRRGMAQQRQCLLDHTAGMYALFLDDDVLLEPWALEVMVQAIKAEECGLVGMFVVALSYKNDVRPHQQKVKFWAGPVKPEKIRPDRKEWERASLHRAANVLHVSERLNITPEEPRLYKIAWIGACKLYDTEKLRRVGGFNFWRDLPSNHSGEDVMAQLKVLEKFGGCGLLPSGAYHQELKTTITDRRIDAYGLLLKNEENTGRQQP